MTRKPFFARFLEAQELDSVTGAGGGPPRQTMKYPSDDDEDLVPMIRHTRKYPSDDDEGEVI